MSYSPAPAEGPITTAPASDAPAWRGAVIGLVALLAFGIGAALGAYLLGFQRLGMGAAASYVPATAPMYVEVRLEPSLAQDAALRDLLRRFPPIDGVDLDRPLTESLAERLDEMLAAEGESVSWQEDVAPWFDGRLGFALLDGAFIMPPPATDPTAPPPVPPMLVMLGVTDPDVAAASLDRLLSEMDPALTFTESVYTGLTVHEASTGQGAYVLTADQLVYASSIEALRDALDAHASGETFAASGLADELPADWIAMGVYDFSNVMSDLLAYAGTQTPATVEAYEAMFENQPLRAAFAISATEDGFAMDAFADAPTGPLAPTNADRGLADEVPADALYFADGGNVGPALASLIEALKGALAADPAMAEQITMAEAGLGADLEEMVGWIGDGATVVGWAGTTPYGGLVLVPSDMDEAERRLGQLATFAELAATDPTTGLAVTRSEVETDSGLVTITTIRWQQLGPDGTPDPAVPGVVVEYTVTDDRALIGIGETFVRRALDLEASDSLAADPRYRDSVAGLGGPENAGTSWLDITGAREALEAALLPMFAAADPSGTYESEVQPWLLPLDRFVSVTRVDGEQLETHAVLFIE